MAFPDKPAAHLLGSNGPIHAVTYSASPGTYILTGSADRSIRLYNPSPSTAVHPASSYISKQQAKQAPAIPEGRLIQTYAAHGYEVLSLAVASDNARFASSGGDRAVFLWDVTTAQTLRRFSGNGVHGHGSRINCVAFGGADDSLVISGGFDTTVRIWDTKSGGTGGGKPIQILTEARDAVSALVVRGPEIISGSVDGRVRTYDIRMGSVVTDVIGASVTSLSLTMDGNTVLVGSLDNKVRLMDRANGACLMTYTEEGWRNEELRVQSILGGKEKYILTGDEMTVTDGASGGDGNIWAWDLLTGKLVAKVAVPWGPRENEPRKKVIGRDGKEREKKNIVSCLAWREHGWGDQFCVGGTSGVVTVFGSV